MFLEFNNIKLFGPTLSIGTTAELYASRSTITIIILL